MCKRKSFVLLAVLMMTWLTQQQTLLDPISNLVCPTGTFTLSSGSFTPALEYDATSLYYDGETDDSARLFVKFGSSAGPTNFKIFRYNQDLTERTQKQCGDSASLIFVKIVNRVLVLKDNGNPLVVRYYACLFDAEAEGNLALVPLDRPSQFDSGIISEFIPFYWEGSTRKLSMLLIGNATAFQQSWVCDYVFPQTITAPAAQITPTKLGIYMFYSGSASLGDDLNEIVGTDTLISSPQLSAIKYLSNSNNWVDSVLLTIQTGQTYKMIPISGPYAGITIYNSAASTGTIQVVSGNTDHSAPGNGLQKHVKTGLATAFNTETDTISNFIVYTAGYLYWFNLDFNSEPRSVLLQDPSIDTENHLSVSLTSNKMALMYSDRIEFFRIEGAGVTSGGVRRVLTKTFSQQTATQLESDGKFKLTYTCMCAGLKELVCYSSTLNCIIINKAAQECSVKDLPPWAQEDQEG